MLVFLYIILILIILNIVLYFSSIIIEFDNIKIDTTKRPIINDYNVNIYLSFSNKIKYLKISAYKEKIDKIKGIDFDKIKEKIVKLKIFSNLKEKGLIYNTNEISKVIKKTNITLERLNIKAEIGYDNIVVLSYIVALLDILISIILARKMGNNKNFKNLVKNYEYIITPEQTKGIYLKSHINVEFTLKISNIVKISCNLKKIKV